MKSATASCCVSLVPACLMVSVFCFAHPAFSSPILFSASGPDAAAIQSTVDLFRATLGTNNGNLLGSQSSGRREINWDGGGAAANAALFPTPMTTFNSGVTTRGLVSTTPGVALEISGQPLPEFGEINATYPAAFQTFSAPRLFSPIGSNVMDALFFVPGSSTPANVFAFGAIFTDVDLANTSSLQLFSPDNVLLGSFFAPTFNNGLSFLGVISADPIGRVRITTGNTPLGPTEADGIDVVALDDFIYSEPSAVPEPATLLLLGSGLAVAVRARRKRAG